MRAPPAGRASLAAIAAGLALLASGCGAASSGDPASEKCLNRWNDDEIALTLGRHAYDGHQVRRALVEETAAPKAKNVRTDETCLVVFAVQEGDGESGRLGLVVTRFGWSQLFELGLSDAELQDLQRSATENANASLFPDGSLEAE